MRVPTVSWISVRPRLWGELVSRVFGLGGVVEGISQVSPASSRAVFLADRLEELAPETSLAPGRRLEPVHLHGVEDTSVHLVLPPDRGAELVRSGWAEPHPYADFGTEFMVYGPRDSGELEVVVSIIEESLAFARSPTSDDAWSRVDICSRGPGRTRRFRHLIMSRRAAPWPAGKNAPGAGH